MSPQDTLTGRDLAETWIENKKGKLRIALYSHDTMGIGHMRRNLLIAQTLARSAGKGSERPGSEPLILLITGGREACAFGLPAGTDCLTLPALAKEEDGQYRARCWDMSLKELLALRSRSIAASLRGFAPDVLIVDKVPRGAGGELEQALQELHTQGGTRLVLGLRDVLDDPETVRQEWQQTGAEEAIRNFYDAVWIYGDRRVFDPVAEYRFSREVSAKVSYSGYLVRKETASLAALSDSDLPPGLGESIEDLVLCLVGGGQDGSQLAETFALTEFPAGTTGVILTGPFMPQAVQNRLQRQAQKNQQLRVLRFVTDPDLLLGRASRVVAMGGYNTVCEIIAANKPALIVPRVKPRREQLIRAERMRDLGLVDVLHPNDLSVRALKTWLGSRPAAVHPRDGSPGDVRCPIDLEGLDRLPQLLQKLVDLTPRSVADNVAETHVPERSNPYACF